MVQSGAAIETTRGAEAGTGNRATLAVCRARQLTFGMIAQATLAKAR